jgi:hypothetical protein
MLNAIAPAYDRANHVAIRRPLLFLLITVLFAPIAPAQHSLLKTQHKPSIFEAVKQQLRLKLQAQKGPVEYYVIDHIDGPSEN